MDQQLLDFYSGDGRDFKGRTLNEILSWPDEKLEAIHDYIQWLFPLQEMSAYNPNAPLLSEHDISLFKSNKHLQEQVRRSFERMLAFYGFSLAESNDNIQITKANNFEVQSRYWLNKFNHNHLRITRILKCLYLVGLGAHAEGLFWALSEVYLDHGDVIGVQTLRFWRAAVT